MIIEVKQPTFLLDKSNPTKISYNNEDGDNWKAITVQTYLHGFPHLKEGEILYKYKDRGYIGKSYEDNKHTELNNTDKRLYISDVMNSILNELEELKSMYKRWDDDKDSFISMNGVYRHKASGIDDSIKIVKKYCA